MFRVPRDVVEVSGPDATSFLQSLVSQDLDPVAVGDAVRSLLLQPQGKLIADFEAIRVRDDAWWLVTERGYGAVVRDALARFKIRVNVELELLDDVAAIVSSDAVDAAGVFSYRTPLGHEHVGTADRINALGSASDDYERARVVAGVPRLGVDIDERTIPQEAALELDAVSFTKGCFVGQELVCRIDSRGHVNKFLRRLRTADDVTLPPGAEVIANDAVVGAVTSAVPGVALATVRREIEPGVTVRVGGTDAQVEVAAYG